MKLDSQSAITQLNSHCSEQGNGPKLVLILCQNLEGFGKDGPHWTSPHLHSNVLAARLLASKRINGASAGLTHMLRRHSMESVRSLA